MKTLEKLLLLKEMTIKKYYKMIAVDLTKQQA